MVIVQSLVHQDRATILFEIGPITVYKEGSRICDSTNFAVINIVSAFGVLILTTKPDDLVESLIQKGMSPKIGYVLLSVLQIIPQLMATTGKITDAQRSRGWRLKGINYHE